MTPRDLDPLCGSAPETPVSDELLRDPAATIADLVARVRMIEREWRRASTPRRATIKSDAEIRADVIRELQWDPQVTDANAIGVAVRDGAVTLTGSVPSYAEKVAASRSAARIYGVRAVADEIKVRLSGEVSDDASIARAISRILELNTQIPERGARAKVQAGRVTLEGQTDYAYRRHEAERVVRHVPGVIGITNNITVTPPVSPDKVQVEIEDAFTREAAVDARQIRVEVSDHVATLYGHVHSLHEATAAMAAAAAAPGVARVQNHLLVSP
jgi:osmotically-inducible protein OsmY